VNVLKSPVNISTAFDPRFIHKPPEFKEFIAVWDTGATNTFISQKVIDDCDLKPTGVIDVQTAGKGFRSPVYLANLMLPNQVGFANFRVARATIADGDVLIGMDVMAIGDFAVTNKDGKTAFSFRMPSIERIDFTEESRKAKEPLPPRHYERWAEMPRAHVVVARSTKTVAVSKASTYNYFTYSFMHKELEEQSPNYVMREFKRGH